MIKKRSGALILIMILDLDPTGSAAMIPPILGRLWYSP